MNEINFNTKCKMLNNRRQKDRTVWWFRCMYGRIGMQSTWNSPATLAVVSAGAPVVSATPVDDAFLVAFFPKLRTRTSQNARPGVR